MAHRQMDNSQQYIRAVQSQKLRMPNGPIPPRPSPNTAPSSLPSLQTLPAAVTSLKSTGPIKTLRPFLGGVC